MESVTSFDDHQDLVEEESSTREGFFHDETYDEPGDGLACDLADRFGLDFMPLGDDFRIGNDEVRLIPEAMAREHGILAVKAGSDMSLLLVMKDPLDLDAVDAVRVLTRMEVRKAVSSEARILAAIDRFYQAEAHIEQNLQDIVEVETGSAAGISLVEDDEDEPLRVQANDAPVVRFVNLLLMQAVRDRASDIHFEPGEKKITVRLRVDGKLREITPPPRHLYRAIVTRIKILSEMDIAERRLPLDGRFKFKANERTIDVRVSSLPEVFGEKLVLRILNRDMLVVDMEKIGLEEVQLRRLQELLHLPQGIVLLTGPTGSGETSTLYSSLQYLRGPERNIQTVEDPVEYVVPGINQMAIRSNIGLDFPAALRSILRQDPDVIMIGEIRDVETARIAIRAALTGHLVLSTLHTNDAASAISRLRDIGVEPYLIAATVKLVIAQRLVRRICEACRVPAVPDPAHLQLLGSMRPDAAGWSFLQGAGCERCGHTGYYGRTGIFEFLEATETVRQCMLDGTGELRMRRQAIEEGLESLMLNGMRKVEQGITTTDELFSVCPAVSRD